VCQGRFRFANIRRGVVDDPSLDAIAVQAGDDPTSVLYMSERDGTRIVCPVASIERGFHVEQEPHAILSVRLSNGDARPSDMGVAAFI